MDNDIQLVLEMIEDLKDYMPKCCIKWEASCENKDLKREIKDDLA